MERRNSGAGKSAASGTGIPLSHLCELVQPSTAEVLMTYGKDFYDGMPAMTRNVYGKGKAYAVCADFEQGLYDEVCRKLAEEAGVERSWKKFRKVWKSRCVSRRSNQVRVCPEL